MTTPLSEARGSRVQLTFFSLFHLRGETAQKLVPLVGVERMWRSENGGLHVDVASVPFHNRVMDRYAPRAGGLLALFGIRDALDELQYWRTIARQSKAEFASLPLQVEVGSVHAGVVTREVLRTQGEQLRFLNVRRNAAGLQKELLQHFAHLVAEEGGEPGTEMASVAHMATRPDLYARVMEQDPDFRHVDVLVFPLADRSDPRYTRQVAYLRAGAPITQQQCGDPLVQMHLPSWMGEAVHEAV